MGQTARSKSERHFDSGITQVRKREREALPCADPISPNALAQWAAANGERPWRQSLSQSFRVNPDHGVYALLS
ncbi:hypothetical protein Msi02_84780 [Microbispora siamensis]|uniref:Uncharacterized protein n=1 Tax=Microbispora siamensis TaxID=564413 RepID=A0ABQ4H1T3_9ACTN|nr:hypothetical protein Msi02_84780 [Microbispora siamensis]